MSTPAGPVPSLQTTLNAWEPEVPRKESQLSSFKDINRIESLLLLPTLQQLPSQKDWNSNPSKLHQVGPWNPAHHPQALAALPGTLVSFRTSRASPPQGLWTLSLSLEQPSVSFLVMGAVTQRMTLQRKLQIPCCLLSDHPEFKLSSVLSFLTHFSY